MSALPASVPDRGDLTVAVMTYNRPDYLKNCLGSVQRNMPWARILVVDDRSDDPEQVALLTEMAAQPHVTVLSGQAGEDWHGGLYANMQRALDQCETSMLLMLQDDTQIVRPVGPEEADLQRAYFDRTGAGFLFPFFVKGRKRLAWRKRFSTEAGGQVLTPGINPKTGQLWYHYADIHLANVPALRAAGWRFRRSEGQNEAQAAEAFEQGMAILNAPWGFFCPEVPVIRHREASPTLVHRLLVRGGRPVNAFADMAADAVVALKQRAPGTLPIAEDWLTPVTPGIRRPFVFEEIKRNLFVWALHWVEMRLRGR